MQANTPLNVDVAISGLGKLNKADIKLRPFTVIAGCNSSGKSFVTRSLYSLFSFEPVTTIDHEFSHTLERLEEATADFLQLLGNIQENEKGKVYKFGCLLREIKSIENNHLENKILIHKKLTDFETTLETFKKRPEVSSLLSVLVTIHINRLKNFLDKPETAIELLNSQKLHVEFIGNFMTPSVSELIGKNKSQSSIDISCFGSVKFSKNNEGLIETTYNLHSSHAKLPVYLESPVYWKLAGALRKSQKELIKITQQRRLGDNSLVNQAPKYFFDLIEMLEVQVKNPEFNDIAEKIEQAIGGNLSFNDGTMQFNEKGGSSVGLNLTALGITNLGMIALLLRRGAIMKDTFLFIDEPEVHLHPAWQVVFIQVLHALSKRGVNVVIASHSIDMMKAIETIMDEDDKIDPQTHFGINQLTADGNSVNDSEDNYKRLAAIKKDLGTPFYNMQINGLDL